MSSPISDLLNTLNMPHITHGDIQPLIEALGTHPKIKLTNAGNSFEGRRIRRITYGQGPIVILAWTQMHGDEATATAAVFDLLDQLLNEDSKRIQTLFTFHIVPMLNPDGAQLCMRENAQGIDINRDARALQSPEGRILMNLVDELQPGLALNLHDQSPYYQCGTNGHPSTIAFLAPAFDADKTIDGDRHLAMSLIGRMKEALGLHIKHHIARYDDGFSARAFGDCIAGKGVATVLIESGAAVNDPNRQVARKMNVIAIREAMLMLDELERGAIKYETLDEYKKAYSLIPANTAKTFSSIVVRGLNFVGEHSFKASVSIKQTARYSNEFYIDAVGDLGPQAGLEEFNAQDLSFDFGRVHNIKGPLKLTNKSYREWLQRGILRFEGDPEHLQNLSDYDVLMNHPTPANTQVLALDQPAYFLMRKGTKVVAAVINGKLLRLF